MMHYARKPVLGILVASLAFTLVALACSVSISPGTTDTTSGQLTFTFGLGSTGIFTLNTGIPVSNSALISGLPTSTQTPQAAVMRLDTSEINVTPLSTGQTTALTGTITVSFKMGPSSSTDPCADGVDVGALNITVVDGQVTNVSAVLDLPPQALAYAATGAFTLCITVEADFDAVVTIGDLNIDFDDDESGNHNQDDGDDDEDDNAANDDDGGNDNFSDTDDNEDDGGLADDANENEANVWNLNSDQDPGNDNEFLVENDNSSDVDNDNSADSRMTYVNLTNDADQNPDSGFDAQDHFPSISADGTVVAYLSDVDTTGEGSATPNDEVMVLLGLSKVQVTQTTETTNTSGNTYDVTNWGPILSRDGSAVAFASDGDLLSTGYVATDQIYLYDVETTELRQLSLLDTPSGLAVRDIVQAPRISADGNTVAWVETDAECQIFGCPGETRLRVTDRTGGDLLTVVFTSEFGFDDYALSGDGTLIVFSSDDNPVFENPGLRRQLFLLSVPQGSITQVTHLSAEGGEWTPSYFYPGINHNGSVIGAWTNDPAVSEAGEIVLATMNAGGSIIVVLARAGVDFSGGDDDPGRPRFSESGAYVSFRTAWAFGYVQRNFRAASNGQDLLDVGIGYKTISPTITSDGSMMAIAGIGDLFYPNQVFQNEDWTDEIWRVTIDP